MPALFGCVCVKARKGFGSLTLPYFESIQNIFEILLCGFKLDFSFLIIFNFDFSKQYNHRKFGLYISRPLNQIKRKKLFHIYPEVKFQRGLLLFESGLYPNFMLLKNDYLGIASEGRISKAPNSKGLILSFVQKV